jgi:predicted transposase YdaD
MPVPVRDTPLGRELFEEGRREGRAEGRETGRHEAAAQMATAWLRERFGDDARIPGLAARLADLSDEDRIARITSATSLDELLER